jgi:hypothetical protein
VNFEQKTARLAEFFKADPREQAAFLERERIRFLYASKDKELEQLARIPGLTLVTAASVGSLYEYGPISR